MEDDNVDKLIFFASNPACGTSNSVGYIDGYFPFSSKAFKGFLWDGMRKINDTISLKYKRNSHFVSINITVGSDFVMQINTLESEGYFFYMTKMDV